MFKHVFGMGIKASASAKDWFLPVVAPFSYKIPSLACLARSLLLSLYTKTRVRPS